MDKREHNYIQGLSLATCGDFDAEAVINGLFVCIDVHLSVYTEVKSGYNAIAAVFRRHGNMAGTAGTGIRSFENKDQSEWFKSLAGRVLLVYAYIKSGYNTIIVFWKQNINIYNFRIKRM